MSPMETGVPEEKPLQAKLRTDYFSIFLFLYLECYRGCFDTFTFDLIGMQFNWISGSIITIILLVVEFEVVKNGIIKVKLHK